MGPSEKSFDQVKSILGKLDRSIDQLRAKRTTPAVSEPPVRAPAAPTQAPLPAAPPQSRPSSVFGRATPLPPRAT